MNVYLTIYCRRLRPDIQIISRSTRERNVSTLHRAGADFVLSYASMGATAIFNYLRRAGVVVVAEGLHLAETQVPETLAGKTLSEAAIPTETGCNVVALRTETKLIINPDPATVLNSGTEIILMARLKRATFHEALRARSLNPSLHRNWSRDRELRSRRDWCFLLALCRQVAKVCKWQNARFWKFPANWRHCPRGQPTQLTL